MKKVLNFRDLGGILTENDKVVKTGLFYRCANLNHATIEDIEYLRSLNIRNIIDFRDRSELGDRSIYDRLGVEYHNLPLNLESAKICNLENNKNFRTAIIPIDKEDMRIAYRRLPFGNDSYHKMVNMIRENELPILFHCAVGKDRTGVAAAIILLLLGAKEEEIVKDYIVSKKIEESIARYVTKNINILVRRFLKKRMYSIFLADESYILASLDEIKNRFNTYDDYLIDEFNIDSKELIDIRNKFLE